MEASEYMTTKRRNAKWIDRLLGLMKKGGVRMNEYASIMFRLLVKKYVNIDIRNVLITIKLAQCLPTLLRKMPQML